MPALPAYVFLDLDDSILQTRAKAPPGAPLRAAATGRDGRALSFMTEGQSALLEMLASRATVIPATARNLDAFRRVSLPFTDMAVLDFGGVVLLPDGGLDAEWDAHVRPQALGARPALEAALEAAERFVAARRLGLRARLVSDFDMGLYLVLKHPEGDLSALDAVRREHWAGVDAERFFVHANGNNLSLVPRFLGKERAVRHILERRLGPGPLLTIGVGDSLSDAPFLALCDYALVPRGSQLGAAVLAETPSP